MKYDKVSTSSGGGARRKVLIASDGSNIRQSACLFPKSLTRIYIHARRVAAYIPRYSGNGYRLLLIGGKPNRRASCHDDVSLRRAATFFFFFCDSSCLELGRVFRCQWKKLRHGRVQGLISFFLFCGNKMWSVCWMRVIWFCFYFGKPACQPVSCV